MWETRGGVYECEEELIQLERCALIREDFIIQVQAQVLGQTYKYFFVW